MRVIALVFTGGTISMRFNAAAGGVVPSSGVEDTLEAAHGIREVATLQPEEFGRVVASRAPRGRVGQTYGYDGGGAHLARLGAIFTGSRRPQQARIDLMLALGLGLSGVELSVVFDA